MSDIDGDMTDEIDRKLLALLRANAREPAAVLAKKLKISRGTVQNRIARMLATRAISGFTVRTAPELETGRVRAVMSIAIQGEQSGKVIKALNGFPQVERIYTTNGRWNLFFVFFSFFQAQISAKLDQIRLIEGIAATETSLLLASTK